MVRKNLVESEDDELLRLSCTSSLITSLEAQPTQGAKFKVQFVGEPEIRDFVWGVINKGHFMDLYFKMFAKPKLSAMLKSAMLSDVDHVSMELPTGKVFFAKSMILNEAGDHYTTENHILVALLNTARQQLYRWSRRLGKSHRMKLDMLHNGIFKSPYYALYTCQSWDVSKEHLRIVERWLNSNPLLFKWSGGEPVGNLRMKWSDSDKYLMNGSLMSCRTATNPEKIAGKSVNGLYEDEKALYPLSAKTEQISILSRGQPESEKFTRMIASAPAGQNTIFEKMCFDKDISQFWDISTLKVCERITFDKKGKPTFHGIVTPRLSQQDLLEEWYELGQDFFMEQFMLNPMIIGDRAVPEDVIDGFFDRDMHTKWSSELPCIVSYDLGKSMAHRSIIMVGEVQPTGHLHIIRIIPFKPGHPIRSRKVRTSKPVKGVIEHIPDLGENYNIQWIIGDTQSMGTDEPLMDLAILMKEGGHPVAPANIIPYKWSKSSKEFMGKAPLWYNLVLPRLQQGWVRSVFDDTFLYQLRTWKATQSPSGTTVTLKAEKQTQADDMITTMMQMVFVAYKGRGTRKSHSRRLPALTSGRRTSSSIARTGKRGQVKQPRWREY